MVERSILMLRRNMKLGSFHRYVHLKSLDSSGQSLNVYKYGNMYVKVQVFHGGEFYFDVVSKIL